MGTKHELKNRHMHVDYAEEELQSAKFEIPKCQNDTLECTLEELAFLKILNKEPYLKQSDLVNRTGKSLRTIKRIMESLQQKNYIRRTNGKRYGIWEVLVDVNEE